MAVLYSDSVTYKYDKHKTKTVTIYFENGNSYVRPLKLTIMNDDYEVSIEWPWEDLPADDVRFEVYLSEKMRRAIAANDEIRIRAAHIALAAYHRS